MNNYEFLLKELENLQEENKRLKSKVKNSLFMRVNFDEQIYEVNTNIELKNKLIEGNSYYISDSYTNPTKVKFLDYAIEKSVNNIILISCLCYNTRIKDYEYYYPKSLFHTKNKASDNYLKNYTN